MIEGPFDPKETNFLLSFSASLMNAVYTAELLHEHRGSPATPDQIQIEVISRWRVLHKALEESLVEDQLEKRQKRASDETKEEGNDKSP